MDEKILIIGIFVFAAIVLLAAIFESAIWDSTLGKRERRRYREKLEEEEKREKDIKNRLNDKPKDNTNE